MRNKFIQILVLVVFFSASHNAWAIKKCQDADGKWHYGDTAIEECENSKITILTDRGFVKGEEERPKTEEELAAEEVANAEERQLEEAQRAAEEEKLRILSIYETAEDIDRQRDNQVRSVQSNIDVHESYLSNMEKRVASYQSKLDASTNQRVKEDMQQKIAASRSRMLEYEKQLQSLRKDKVEILERFKKEKETYLALKEKEEKS